MALLRAVVLLAFHMTCLKPADSSTEVSYEVKQNYCSFFNNRAPMAQPGLKNCTWFKENSCCLQQEIEATFGSVKPLKGAMLSCQKYLNYLMCYICAPNQHIFYQNERLTVCQDFCDDFYQACDSAILKGSPIKNLYSSGKEFCLSRRFLVNNRNCFNFDPALDRNAASKHCMDFHMYLIVLFIIYSLKDNLFSCSDSVQSNKRNVKDKNKRAVSAIRAGFASDNCYKSSVCTRSYKRVGILACLFVGLLTVPLQMVVSQNTDLTRDGVNMWAASLESSLLNLAKEGLQYEKLDNIFSKATYEPETVNASEEILKIRNEFVDFFGQKEAVAIQLAGKVLKLFDNWKHEYTASNVTHLRQLPLTVYRDADSVSHFSSDQTVYDRRFGADVLEKSSAVKVADSTDRGDPEVIDMVQLTASLDDSFTENLQKHPDMRWQYFGSHLGVQRSYPGKQGMRNFVGFAEDFDPRSRPWYLSATSGTKDVVIVIDVSSSMGENGRLSRAREVVQWVLDTMTKQDRVNIVLSRSAHWDSKGVKSEYSASVLGCEKTGLLQATSNVRKQLLTKLSSEPAQGGSNHTEAFHLAFGLLSAGGGGPACNPLLLFVSDGDHRDGSNRCSRGYHKHYHDGTKEFVAGKLCDYRQKNLHSLVNELQESLTQKARVLTFLVESSVKASVASALSLMTCGQGGIMLAVPGGIDIYRSMVGYFDFLKDTTGPQGAVWTSPYLDSSGLGLMMTVSVPVISSHKSSVLGVVGVDVPLQKLENLLRHRVWGEVYGFLVDRSDMAAIIHPYAKPTAQLLEDPVFPPITALETERGRPAAFQQVVQAIQQAETGQLTITQDAHRPQSQQGLVWRPALYTRYVYTDIPDSDFSIVLNLGMSGDSFPFKQGVKRSGSMHYLSDMEAYAEHSTDLPGGLYEALNTTTRAPHYSGVRVSASHSVVHLTPRAFCQPYEYLLGSPTFTQLHTYINSEGGGGDGCQTGSYRRDVWADVQLTTDMLDAWLDRDRLVSISVLWTYIATEAGVMSIYPGVKIHNTYDPTLRTWYRGSRESNSVHTSHVYLNTLPHATKVVTFSKSLHRPLQPGQTCTESDSNCPSTQAVVAMDVSYLHLESLVLDLQSRYPHKFCGSMYPCAQGGTCHTKCLLVSRTSHLVYAEGLGGLPDLPQHTYESVPLASRHGHVFSVLVKEGVFIRHQRLNYQGVCQRFTQSNHAAAAPSFEEEPLRRRGPIPPLARTYSCVQETVFYEANQQMLGNASFMLSAGLEDDPCGEGTFHVLTLPALSLFLVVLEDYRDVGGVRLNCHLTNSVLAPGSFPLEREACPAPAASRGDAGSRPCSTTQADIPCGWSRMNMLRPAGFLFYCMLSLAMAYL